MTPEKRIYKTFDGSCSANSCAYCWKHHKAITPRQLRSRKCVERQCAALWRSPDHPYWIKREKRKEQRAARKERLEKMYEEVTANGVRT